MDEYKPTNKYRAEQKATEERQKLEKVVKGTVKTKKKSEIAKAADVFISEDIKSVKSHIVMEVLIPAVKKVIYDIVTNGIDMILYGETGRTKSKTNAPYVSYKSYSDKRDDRRSSDSSRTRIGYDFQDITLESRGEAEEVLLRMDEALETYGVVTVADLYDLVGITCSYTDNKYGWTSLRDASVTRTRDGYMLKLPRVKPINN